jgi:hypothetical protein
MDKITELNELTAPVVTDLLAAVDDPAGSAETKKMTMQKLIDLVASTLGVFTAWVPSFTGYSADPTGGLYYYLKIGKLVILTIREVTAGTSNSGGLTISLPFTAVTRTNQNWYGSAIVTDNNVIKFGGWIISTAGTAAAFNPGSTQSDTFVTSGNKKVNGATIIYECA